MCPLHLGPRAEGEQAQSEIQCQGPPHFTETLLSHSCLVAIRSWTGLSSVSSVELSSHGGSESALPRAGSSPTPPFSCSSIFFSPPTVLTNPTALHFVKLWARAVLQVVSVAGEGKPLCLSAFELLWEMKALVSGSWRGRGRVLKEISESFWGGKSFFFLLHPKKYSLHPGSASMTTCGSGSIWCALHKCDASQKGFEVASHLPPPLEWRRKEGLGTTVWRKLIFRLLGRCHAHLRMWTGKGSIQKCTSEWCLNSTCSVLPVVVTGPCLDLQGPLLFLRAARLSLSGPALVTTKANWSPWKPFGSFYLIMGTCLWRIHIVLWI